MKSIFFFVVFSVASILMASDKETNSVLVTGDADGYIKVWNIHDYCVDSSPQLNTNPPGQCTTVKHVLYYPAYTPHPIDNTHPLPKSLSHM